MAEEKTGDHGIRTSRNQAVKAQSPAEVAAAEAAGTWKPIANKEQAEIKPPKLRENPAIKTEKERISAIREALNVAVSHMHSSEHGLSKVSGMKTFGLAIIKEQLKLTPEQITNDEGALSDLTEYLIEMIRITPPEFIDIRSSGFNSENYDNPNVDLVTQLTGTWNLPDNEFGQPFVYRRVSWQKRNLPKGN